MKYKKLLAIILLSLSLCFVSSAGYGEIEEWQVNYDTKAQYIRVALLEARVNYMIRNPTKLLYVFLNYLPTETYAENFPGSVAIKGKIIITVYDSRGYSLVSLG